MNLICISSLSPFQKRRIFSLWHSEFSSGVSFDDMEAFEGYLTKWENPIHLLLLDAHGALQGWLFLFDRQGDRWFSMILDASVQGKGHGSRLLDAAKETESRLNGWVVDHNRHQKNNGKPYPSPLEFYMKNGFQVQRDTRFESAQLSAVKILWHRPASMQ